nr:hypothetical protein [Tanacetum cinerariifolium]
MVLMVERNRGEHLIRRFARRGNEPDPRDMKIASLKQRIQELESEEVNPFGGGNPGFHDDHYENPLLIKETDSEPIIWDIGDEEEEYPFVNKYPSFQEEPIVLVEEESCPVYDTDNEEEESMSVYDTDIEDVIEEEERFVGKGGFGGEEDNIEDVIVVANDLCSSMIQIILSVDFEEDINTKSHELMSFGKNLGASVSVMLYSTFSNLGLGESTPTKLIVELVDRTIKCPKGIAEKVLVSIDKFIFPVNFVVLDMPEDIKVPLIIERLFLSTTHAKIDVFKRKITLKVRNDKTMFKSDKPTNNIIKRVYALGLRERMKLDFEAMLMGEALILNRSLDPTYGDCIELNDLNGPLELRRSQVEDLGLTIEDGMGDVIVGKPFCRKICIKAKRFDEMITIYNGYNSVTYQMARSHPRCKHITNAQCYKMRPLLKISARDQLSGILHPYQKLKSFYKGFLNLGPEYIMDAKMEEWLTRGYVSMHEMQ